MLTSRIRAALLGLLAMMLVGSVMAGTASAEAGPFWHHRAIGGSGEGEKIAPKAPENFRGEGGKQTFKGTLGTEKFEITSENTQVKGAIFNTALQGQIKLEIAFKQPTLIKPTIAGCVVTVGSASNNIVQVKGHLMWKWNGTTEQLTEQPQLNQVWDIGFTAVEPTQGATLLNTGSFTVINFINCGVLTSKDAVIGSEVGIPNMTELAHFTTALGVRTVEHLQNPLTQHFWDGVEFQGTHLGLSFGSNAAAFIGQTEIKPEQQEVAVFEK